MSLKRQTAALVLILLLVGAAATLQHRIRRLAMVAYLLAGDHLAPRITAEDAAEVVLFDGAREQDRRALTTAHGDITIEAMSGGAVRLTGGEGAEDHEVCTRRFPRDWSAHQVLRLEIVPLEAPEPLFLTMRARTRPGLWETTWYYQRVILRPTARSWEVNLGAARRFIDPQQVRQLCFALRRRPGGPAPVLGLRRVVMGNQWEQRVPPATHPRGELSMHVLGDTTRVRRLDPVPAQPWLRGATGQVMLTGARNEVLAFQLILRRETDHRLGEPVITLPPLVGPGEIRVQAELFHATHVRVRQRSSASYGLASLGPGDYPDPLVPLVGPLRLARGNNHVWVDLHIPAKARAGTYRGEMAVKFPYQLYRLPIILKVVDATLPSSGRQLVMAYYLPQLVGPAARVEGEALLELERACHRLAQAHGVFLIYDTGLPRLDRYLPMMRGDLYPDGPARGQGAPYWPVPVDGRSRQEVQRQATAFMTWFKGRGLATRPFAYLADEPQSLEDYQRIRRRASWIKGAPPPGNTLPVFVTEQVLPEQPSWPSLVGSVDIWASGDNFPEPAASRRKRTSERFITYNGRPPHSGSQLLDAPGTDLRTWGWVAHRFKMEAWFIWQAAYYRDIYNGGPDMNPLTWAETYDRRREGKGYQLGNGDGVLLYPPPPGYGEPLHPVTTRRVGGRRTPLASTRLKAIRRGVQDRLYLELAGRCGKAREAAAISRRLIPRAMGEAQEQEPPSWPEQEQPWEAARRELIRLVAGCKDGGE